MRLVQRSVPLNAVAGRWDPGDPRIPASEEAVPVRERVARRGWSSAAMVFDYRQVDREWIYCRLPEFRWF
jgi:hypothetical protein